MRSIPKLFHSAVSGRAACVHCHLPLNTAGLSLKTLILHHRSRIYTRPLIGKHFTTRSISESTQWSLPYFPLKLTRRCGRFACIGWPKPYVTPFVSHADNLVNITPSVTVFPSHWWTVKPRNKKKFSGTVCYMQYRKQK